jgi:hypothetical protein
MSFISSDPETPIIGELSHLILDVVDADLAKTTEKMAKTSSSINWYSRWKDTTEDVESYAGVHQNWMEDYAAECFGEGNIHNFRQWIIEVRDGKKSWDLPPDLAEPAPPPLEFKERGRVGGDVFNLNAPVADLKEETKKAAPGVTIEEFKKKTELLEVIGSACAPSVQVKTNSSPDTPLYEPSEPSIVCSGWPTSATNVSLPLQSDAKNSSPRAPFIFSSSTNPFAFGLKGGSNQRDENHNVFWKRVFSA